MVKKIKKVVKNELKKSPKISSKRQLNNCDFDEPKKFKKSKQHSSLPGAIVEPNNSIISNNNSSVWVTLQTSNIHELESVELNKNKNENNCEIEIKKEILDIDDQIVETAEVELNKNKIVNPEIAQVVVNKKNNSKDFPISDDSPEKLKKGVESKNKNYVEDQDSDTSGHLPLPSDDDAPGILSIEEKRVHNEKNKQDQEKIVDLETKKSKKNIIEFEENENKKNKITEKIENKNSSSKGKVKFDLSGSGDSGESENEEFHSQKKSEKNKKVDSPILKNQEIKKGSTALKNSEIKNVEYTQKDLPSSDSEKDDDEDSTKISTQNKKNPDKNLDDSPSKAKRKMKKKKSKKILSPSKIALVDSDDSDDSGVDENNLKKLNEVKKKLKINSPSNSADLSGKNKKEKDFSWAGKRVQVVKDLPSSETSPERMTLDDKNLTSRGIQTIESSIRREDENSGDEEEKSVPPRPRKMRKKMIRRGEKHKIPRPEVVQEVFSGFEDDDDENDDDDDDDESGNDKPREISDEKAMKLRRMKIKLSHEPPPQHFIEKLAGSRPLSDDDRVEFEKYVKLKKGTFESDEDEIIKRNWEDFCLVNDWDKRDFKPFLYLRHNYKYFLPTVEERKKFLRYLGRDLNNRCLYSILNRFHILYTKTKSSRYSKDEDKFIMKCMKNPGIKNKCSMIGKQLNRTNQSVWRRIKILEREHCTPGHKTATKKKKLDDNNDVSLKKKKKKENQLNDNLSGSREEIGDEKKSKKQKNKKKDNLVVDGTGESQEIAQQKKSKKDKNLNESVQEIDVTNDDKKMKKDKLKKLAGQVADSPKAVDNFGEKKLIKDMGRKSFSLPKSDDDSDEDAETLERNKQLLIERSKSQTPKKVKKPELVPSKLKKAKKTKKSLDDSSVVVEKSVPVVVDTLEQKRVSMLNEKPLKKILK